MRQLSDKNFKGEIEQAGLAVVMFSAPWAGPCNLVRPAFENVARRYGNRILFGEFSLDDNPDTPEKYGVRQVPLFVVFRDGKPMAVKTGALPEDILVEICEKVLE